MHTQTPDHAWFLNLPNPMIVGHRGAAGHAPENTIISFTRALELGADALELDVQPTADGDAVVIHDRTVDRTTESVGAVESMTMTQLKKLDAGYRFTPDQGQTFPFRDQGHRFTTLTETLEAFPGIRFVVEIKRDTPALCKAVLRAIRNARAQDRVLVGSFKDEALRYLRECEPSLATGAGTKETKQFVIASHLHASGWVAKPYFALQVPPRYGRWPVITEITMNHARKHGLHVQVWTIDEPDEMRRLVALGVHGITTNYPDRARFLTKHRSCGNLPA